LGVSDGGGFQLETPYQVDEPNVRPHPTLISTARQKAVVRERFDGRLSSRFKKKGLEFKEVDLVRAEPAARVFAIKIRKKRPKYIPPPTHSWKRGSVAQGLR
jgi:hypothetical protein